MFQLHEKYLVDRTILKSEYIRDTPQSTLSAIKANE